MKLRDAVIVFMMLATMFSHASAQEQACRRVKSTDASFLEQCGNRLVSFALNLSEPRLGISGINREVGRDIHGRFWFVCSVAQICENDPTAGGFFVDAEKWDISSKDDLAIFETARSVPLMAISWSVRGGAPPPLPSAACPVFDVSVGGMRGRAVCIEETEAKMATILLVAGDERVAFMLNFQQRDVSALALRDKVLELLPRFTIERATGDVALMKWMR